MIIQSLYVCLSVNKDIDNTVTLRMIRDLTGELHVNCTTHVITDHLCRHTDLSLKIDATDHLCRHTDLSLKIDASYTSS